MNSIQARKRFAAPRTALLAASLCSALSLSAVLAPDSALAASAKAASVTTTYANFQAPSGPTASFSILCSQPATNLRLK